MAKEGAKFENDSYYFNLPTKHGDTVLSLALMGTPNSRRNELLSYLLAQSLQVNTVNTGTFWTPVHWACLHGDTQIVEQLIARKVNAFTPTQDGLFPIDLAGKGGFDRIVALLAAHSVAEYKATSKTNQH